MIVSYQRLLDLLHLGKKFLKGQNNFKLLTLDKERRCIPHNHLWSLIGVQQKQKQAKNWILGPTPGIWCDRCKFATSTTCCLWLIRQDSISFTVIRLGFRIPLWKEVPKSTKILTSQKTFLQLFVYIGQKLVNRWCCRTTFPISIFPINKIFSNILENIDNKVIGL